MRGVWCVSLCYHGNCLQQRIVRVKKIDEDEEEGAELQHREQENSENSSTAAVFGSEAGMAWQHS